MSFDRTKLPIVHFKSDGVLQAEDFTLGPHLGSLILARGTEQSEQKEFGVDSDQIRISGHESVDSEESDDHIKFLDARIVSRRHASIAWKLKEDDFKPRLYVKDLGSTHGTFLRYNGQTDPRKLVPKVDYAIQDADSIIIGRKVEKMGECYLPVIFDVSFGESAKAVKMPEIVAKPYSTYIGSPICIESGDESDYAEHGSASKLARILDSDSELDDLDGPSTEPEARMGDDYEVMIENLDSFDSEMGNDYIESVDFDEQFQDDDSQISGQSYDRESEAQSEEEEEEQEDPSTDLTDHSDQGGAVTTIKEEDREILTKTRKLIHRMSSFVDSDDQSGDKISSSAITGSKDVVPSSSTEVDEQEEDATKKILAEKEAENEVTEQEREAEQAEDSDKVNKPILAREVEEAEVIVEDENASTSLASVKGPQKLTEEKLREMVKSATEPEKVAAVVEDDATVSLTSVQVTTTTATKRKAEEAELDAPQGKQPSDAPSPTPKRRIVGFRTGLAAGFVAGVVGTIIGLSSIPLSEGL
ncbi:uncharacterized protein FA14DRAFT_159307 [Meira miltonrushii]|uniref:FHA domain-containing protein n=1 Tax=Meira miltonrushii TaxID=1280837 RepID=A0A316VHV0_9BASI|nr:uncharacterized protein FA14DRAFT_159307 [Meira miltonrushii]PWN37116.1 hypothetical protein FA14DRAFT_159307 [Meira miltonrushii]